MLTDFISKPVRAAAALTTTDVAGTVLENCEKFNTLSLLINFSKGSLTDAQIKVEVSNDKTNWYQLLADNIAAGVNTVSGLVYKLTDDVNGATSLIKINNRYIRISAKGTGTVTGSSLAITAILGKI